MDISTLCTSLPCGIKALTNLKGKIGSPGAPYCDNPGNVTASHEMPLVTTGAGKSNLSTSELVNPNIVSLAMLAIALMLNANVNMPITRSISIIPETVFLNNSILSQTPNTIPQQIKVTQNPLQAFSKGSGPEPLQTHHF
jgi:hypothetical protein